GAFVLVWLVVAGWLLWHWRRHGWPPRPAAPLVLLVAVPLGILAFCIAVPLAVGVAVCRWPVFLLPKAHRGDWVAQSVWFLHLLLVAGLLYWWTESLGHLWLLGGIALLGVPRRRHGRAGPSRAADRGARPMTEAEWLACTHPTPMLRYVRGRAARRKMRLF